VAHEHQLTCGDASCAATFPIVDGIPILIDESSSIFTQDEFVKGRPTFFRPSRGLKSLLQNHLPNLGSNLNTEANYARLAELLLTESERPIVLVIGGSIVGQQMDKLLADPRIRFVESDVAFGPRTNVICDAHDMPFEDGSLDAVIAQGVLEHVVDPYRCVAEIHRVLRPGGFVYAESPFMQQVHAGAYDFTRFTPLGHRRLFRAFEELASGIACGPGMALAWAYQYYIVCFARSRALRRLLIIWARLTGFWLKYLDRWLSRRPAALDACSGCFFLGRRSDTVLSDRELIKLYRGAV
jgi:SAM-dependent methyltransferase